MLNKPQNQTNSQETRKTLIYFACIMGLAIIASLFLIFINQSSWQPNSARIVKPLVDRNIKVNAKSYTFYDFSAQSKSVHIKGNFTILDKRDEVISVYILDESNFVYWLNDQNSTKYYDSGKVNSGLIDTNIPTGGRFILVINNLFSEISKNVAVTVDYAFVPLE